MAGLLYFIAGGSGNDAGAVLRDAKLHHLLDGTAWQARGVRGFKAHDGSHAGVIIGPATHPRLGYFPDRQRWRSVPRVADVWVGMDIEAPPTPADLLRPAPLAGHEVPLMDGQTWLCPVARELVIEDGNLAYAVALPQVSDLDEEGCWVAGAIDRRHAHLWPIAEHVWDAMSGAVTAASDAGDGRAVLRFDDLHRHAVTALAANYRLGPAEVALLGLLGEEAALAVLQALVDWPVLRAWLESKRAALTTPAAAEPGVDPAGNDA